MKINPQNEKLKRRFFRWLKEAEGLAEATIRTIERAICVYEDFSGHKDFREFSERQAVRFKNWLDRRQTRAKSISTSTKYHYLRHLQTFLKWLATQPGYKSRITMDAVSYLSLDKKSVRDALAVRPRRFPSLEYVLDLTGSIGIQIEIDQRDRALIAFLLLSGMRYKAICTLSLACFDTKNLTVYQDPKLGVQTKAGKMITTRLFRFDDKLVAYVVGWANYLQAIKRFSPTDPLFPRNKIEQEEGGLSFVCRKVEPAFWAGGNSIREILKRRALEADLPYYNPHAFRHAAVHLASQRCVTPEQFKAVSQNLGHEHVFTTLKTYGTLDDHQVSQVLSEIELQVGEQHHVGGIPPAELEKFLKIYQKKS